MTGQLVDLLEYYHWGEELTETRSLIQVHECVFVLGRWGVEEWAGRKRIQHSGCF